MRAHEFIIEATTYPISGAQRTVLRKLKDIERKKQKPAEPQSKDQKTPEDRTDPKLCRSTKRLGRSDYSSCVSQGLRPHQSKGKGHTDGHGNYLKGKKAKSVKYGGSVKGYDGK